MSRNLKSISILMICFLICSLQTVTGKDLQIGEVDFQSLRWGEQRATVEATNNSSLTKFIIIEIEIKFTGTYLNPKRITRSSFVLPPGKTTVLDPAISIPGNFGSSKVSLKVYDVVDTLDIILPDHVVFEQPFFLNFIIPDALVPYLQFKVLYPPRVGDDIDFDNEFSRFLPLLISDGYSPGEIADMAMCDTSFVVKMIERLMDLAYARKNEAGEYVLNFPVIPMDEADKGRALAIQTADSLSKILSNNIDAYYRVVDSLKLASKVPKDTNSFYDGGALLYFPYPIINGLGLWWDLAENFISPNTSPMEIYSYSDPCEIQIPLYMYAVVGYDDNNGSHYFSSMSSSSGVLMYFGDSPPSYQCARNYSMMNLARRYTGWSIPDGFEPRGFMIDTSIVRPAIDALVREADPLIKDTYDKVTKLGLSYNREKLTRGYYFWFWNLVATNTANKLIETGVVPRMGNGQFKFDSFPM